MYHDFCKFVISVRLRVAMYIENVRSTTLEKVSVKDMRKLVDRSVYTVGRP